jgi:hypothetical protein
MPLPDKFKQRGAAMAQAFGKVLGFSRGGRIIKGSAAIKKKMAKLRAMKKRTVQQIINKL